MFKKKSKIDQNPELTSQVSQDLIVHNMPNMAKISSIYSSGAGTSISSGFKTSSDQKSNFKVVGLIIMIIGLIFISGLVYFSYIFIIKPATNQNNQTVAVKESTTNSKIITTSTPQVSAVVTAVTSEAAAITATVSDLTTTTAVTVATTTSGEQNISGLPPLIDSDNDGLNDSEEEVFGTSATSSDTNNNSYPDLVEINSNYNPSGIGRLSANTNLATYTNKVFNYQILSPKTWPQQSLNNEATTIFTTPDNSLIQISVQSNSNKSSILNWYETLFPKVTPSYDHLKNINNWEGIMGEDNLNFYLTDKTHSNVFVISYIPAISDRIVYPNVFKMIINSLIIN